MTTNNRVESLVHHWFASLARITHFQRPGRAPDYVRRLGEVSQVIHVRVNQSRALPGGLFCVECGLSFDRLWSGTGQAVPRWPGLDECHFVRRLDYLVPGAPGWSRVVPLTDL